MSLCWLPPAQRPSLRELRIMLLHLRSSRDELEADEFDRRWNQLMPRSPVAITTTLPSAITDTNDDEEEAEMRFSLAPSSLPKRDSSDVHNTMLPMVHGLGNPGIPAVVRPASFDSEFGSEFNASLLAQAGSRQESLRSFSTSPGNTPDDVTLDESFTGMAQHFQFSSNERSLTTELNVTTSSTSAFEMVSYIRTRESEVTESRNELKVNVEVNVSDSIPKIPVSNAISTETTGSQETVKDSFDSGEEEWQRFSDSSANQKSDQVGGTEGVEVSANVCSDVGSNDQDDAADVCQEDAVNMSVVQNGHSTECNVGSMEDRDSRDGSFCMLKVSVGGEDESPTKSLDVDSPAKSTTSSADWCLVSNHTEHSRDEELDAVSQVTDPSLPGDCVLVESRAKVGEEASVEELLNTDSAVVQENASEHSAASAVDEEQPTDGTADH